MRWNWISVVKRKFVRATLMGVLVIAPLVTFDEAASSATNPCSNTLSPIVSKACAAYQFKIAQRTTGIAWRASIPLLSSMKGSVSAAQISAVVQPVLKISNRTDSKLLAMRWPSAVIERAVAKFVASDRVTQAAVKSVISQWGSANVMAVATTAGSALALEGSRVSALFKRLGIAGAPLRCTSSVLSVVCP